MKYESWDSRGAVGVGCSAELGRRDVHANGQRKGCEDRSLWMACGFGRELMNLSIDGRD